MSKSLCCGEYDLLDRRGFLGAGAAAVAAISAPAWLPRVAYARAFESNRDVIVSVFLRGGMDGLTACVPHGDDEYYTARPTLNIPRPDSGEPHAASDLDGYFGLAPAMTPLLPAYLAADLLFVHATGSMNETRSHFDAMRFMEFGTPGDPQITTGWLGRHLLSKDPLRVDAVLRGIGITPGLPKTLEGGPLTLPVANLDTFSMVGDASTQSERLLRLRNMYAASSASNALLAAAAETTRATVQLLTDLNFATYQPYGGAAYPAGEFGTAMKSAAALIKADVGIEAIAVDFGGWDTHQGAGPRDGYLATHLGELAAGLAAFHVDVLTGGYRDVTLVAMSEFGRVVAENFSLGVDHGHGGLMMVMGGHVAGGRVLRQWPGLAPEQLFQGQDLDVTMDYRDILAELVQVRLMNNDLSFVFPGFVPTNRGVTTP